MTQHSPSSPNLGSASLRCRTAESEPAGGVRPVLSLRRARAEARACSRVLATAALALFLAGCAANTVNTGPVQDPVPEPRVRRGSDAPDTPPVRQRPRPGPDPSVAEQPTPPPAPVPAPTPPAAPAPPAGANEASAELNSVLWVQTSAEYEGAALQAYRLARQQLEQALADDSWSALVGDPGLGGPPRPPAIILDVDETVLDNTPFEARLILEGREASGGWTSWCQEAAADAVPGALEFIRAAEARGVAVFYVTNRNHEVEEPTRENLERLGFPLGEESGEDRVLTRGEREEWGSEKHSRRLHVSERYRPLLLIGDDLGDFLEGVRTSREDRAAIQAEHQDRWGRQWILIPNPMYGSWLRALGEEPRDGLDPRRGPAAEPLP